MREFLRGTVTPKDWVNVGVIVTIAAIIGAVFLLFIHSDQTAKLDAIRSDDAQAVKDLRSAKKIAANIDGLRTEMRNLNKVVADFEKRLPLDRDIPQLVKKIEGIAQASGVQLKDLKSLPRQEDPNKERIPYKITASGDFNQIAGFINRLERYERYLKVSDLNIGKQEGGVSDATFTLSTYRFIEAKPPAGSASGAGGAAR